MQYRDRQLDIIQSIINRLVLTVVVLVSLFSASFSHAQNLVFNLEQTNEKREFSRHYVYLEDESKALTLEQILTPKFQNEFQLGEKEQLSFGYSSSAIWLKFDVQIAANKSNDSINDRWLLQLDYPLLDSIEVYSQDGSGKWVVTNMGDQFKFDQRPISHRNFALPLLLNTNTINTYYVRVETTSSMQIVPTLRTQKDFFEGEISHEVLFGLIYGIMALMAIYNSFLYIAVRDKVYLAYIVSVVTGAMFIMALNGHAFKFFWPNSPEWANTAVPFFSSLWMVGTIYFAQIFLETDKHTKRMHSLLNLMLVLAIMSTLLSLVGSYIIAIKVATSFALISGLLILWTSIVSWHAGHSSARFFVFAWSFYELGTAMLILSRFGSIPNHFMTHNSASVGLLIEVVLLSFALSDKYRELTNQLAEYAHKLEDKVALRTAELEQANIELHNLSRTDPLTDLANRRQFNEQLEAEWSRHLRMQKPLGILIGDIDKFKGINDYFGHSSGDECLVAVARAIKQSLARPGDLGIRLGGDEFAVLLPETDIAGAENMADKINAEILKLKIENPPGMASPYVSMSIGSASLIPNANNSTEALLNKADEVQYSVKRLRHIGNSR